MNYRIEVFEGDNYSDETIFIDIDIGEYRLDYIKELLNRDLLDGNYAMEHNTVKYYLSGRPGAFTNRDRNREIAKEAQRDFFSQLNKINKLERLLKYFRAKV